MYTGKLFGIEGYSSLLYLVSCEQSYPAALRASSIRNKNNWNNVSKSSFGSYSYSGIFGFSFRLFCSQKQNSRNILLFRNIPNERALIFLIPFGLGGGIKCPR